jgi:hypothetical protein
MRRKYLYVGSKFIDSRSRGINTLLVFRRDQLATCSYGTIVCICICICICTRLITLYLFLPRLRLL